jgi:hypothetical protein
MARGAGRHGTPLASRVPAITAPYLVELRPIQKAWIDAALVLSKPADAQSWPDQLQNMPLSFFELLGTL